MTEHDMQCSLIDQCRLYETQHPELELLFAVPMGGKRSKVTAARLKAEGAKAGVPDLCLAVARQGHHGLWIEMKLPGARPSTPQRWWIRRLREQGYRVEVCRSAQAAWDVLMEYLT